MNILDDYPKITFENLMNKYNRKWYESIFFVVKGGKNYEII
jgi:hypothetical protein